MDEKIIRENIKNLLKGGQAHMTLKEAVQDFPVGEINTTFTNGTYSAWHLLEHIMRTQRDILNFIISPNYIELEWPKDYWPSTEEKATTTRWDKTLNEFFTNLKTLEELVMDRKVDLSKKVPNGDGQTYIREFLLVADHNSYHLGEFAIMRQVMNTWKK